MGFLGGRGGEGEVVDCLIEGDFVLEEEVGRRGRAGELESGRERERGVVGSCVED